MTLEIVDVPEVQTLGVNAYVDEVGAVYDSGKAGRMIFPTADLKLHISRLHTSAKTLNRSVKTVEKVNLEDGTTSVTFVVRERQERPRKARGGDDAPAAE